MHNTVWGILNSSIHAFLKADEPFQILSVKVMVQRFLLTSLKLNQNSPEHRDTMGLESRAVGNPGMLQLGTTVGFCKLSRHHFLISFSKLQGEICPIH